MDETNIPATPVESVGVTPPIDIPKDINGVSIEAFVPIILIVLSLVGGYFGLNFFKNTKKMSEQQATDAKEHKKEIKEVQKELVQLDKQSNVIIEDVKKYDDKAQEQSVQIQENIDTAAAQIQQHEVADESIQETKNRLKDALDRLGNH